MSTPPVPVIEHCMQVMVIQVEDTLHYSTFENATLLNLQIAVHADTPLTTSKISLIGSAEATRPNHSIYDIKMFIARCHVSKA